MPCFPLTMLKSDVAFVAILATKCIMWDDDDYTKFEIREIQKLIKKKCIIYKSCAKVSSFKNYYVIPSVDCFLPVLKVGD